MAKNHIAAYAASEWAGKNVRPWTTALVGTLAVLLAAGVAGSAEPKEELRDCANGCPTLVVVLAGTFMMGERGSQHEVTIAKSFAIAKTEVTFAEWDVCVAAAACPKAEDGGWGRGDQPVINVSWDDAKRYVTWLSKTTGKDYRLLTEAEWEYAARAGTTGRFSFDGSYIQMPEYAWFADNSDNQTHPVAQKKANAFGLYDMHGNVSEWVEDCWNNHYNSKPEILKRTGGAWLTGDCSRKGVRGGSWSDHAIYLSSDTRFGLPSVSRLPHVGFRVARTL